MTWDMNNMPDMTGQTVIVTGANSGIGLEAARMLAGKGATVIMACRDLTKGKTAAIGIRNTYPDAKLDVMALDLSDLASVRAFVESFLQRYGELHVLVNNAGVMALPERQETADGFEMQLGTNHLGHFALTGLLLDVILRTPDSRVVTVSSGAHTMGRLNFDDLQLEKSYWKWRAYGNSKLANLLFTHELQRRLDEAGCGTLAVAAHPGYTATNLQQHSGFFSFTNHFLAQSVEMGALPTVFAATASGVVGGDYIGPSGFMEMRGYPKKVSANARAHDADTARRLWEVSEQLTGVTYRF